MADGEPPRKKPAVAAGKIDRARIYAVVPARSGSRGVPSKNIKEFCGKPLMAWQIQNGITSKYISRTFVSTDSEEYRRVALAHGAEAPFLRPREISHDTATDCQLFEHFLHWTREHEPADQQPSLLVQLRPTAPCLTVESVDAAIEQFLQNEDENYDSLRSVIPADHEPFNMYFLDTQGDTDQRLVPIIPKSYNKDTSEVLPEPQSVARQILPNIWWHNAYIDIIRPSCILEQGSVMGRRCLAFHMGPDDNADIDTPEQWAAAELKKKALLKAS